MIHPTRIRRGQPLLVLGALLVGWIGVRAALWSPPFELAAGVRETAADSFTAATPRSRIGAPSGDASREAGALLPNDAEDAGDSRDNDETWRLAPPLPRLIPTPVPERDLPAQFNSLTDGARAWPSPFAHLSVSAAAAEDEGVPRTRLAVGHALLTAMGLSQMELPRAMAAYLEMAGRSARNASLAAPPGIPQAARGPARLARAEQATPRRWSGDAWLLLREDSTRALADRPSYGRSQAGAVLRYRLAPSSAHHPQAYVRASSALESPRDAEVAAGVAARPLRQVPVRLAAELRVTDTQAGTKLRPAALAITEFPPLNLPLGARGEAYFQGGYVGGEFDTPFIDGQLRVAREVARTGRTGISVGAAAWAGAQKGASRLDIGPSAAVSFRLGELNSRLSVDYRVRVAGDAEPASGPALTLSAGF